MIDWGDGTAESAATIAPRTFAVSGTHTYATSAEGTQTGSIFFTGGNCTSGATDNFTAKVAAPPPQFTECPAVDQNTGCQYLIDSQQRH